MTCICRVSGTPVQFGPCLPALRCSRSRPGPFNSCGEDGAAGGAGVSGECFAGGFWFAAAAADQSEGAIAQVGQGDLGVAGADAAGILGEGAVFDAEGAVLDAPMGAGEFEQPVGAGRLFG